MALQDFSSYAHSHELFIAACTDFTEYNSKSTFIHDSATQGR